MAYPQLLFDDSCDTHLSRNPISENVVVDRGFTRSCAYERVRRHRHGVAAPNPELVPPEIEEAEESFTMISVPSNAASVGPPPISSGPPLNADAHVVYNHNVKRENRNAGKAGASVDRRSVLSTNGDSSDYVFYKHDKLRTKWEEAALYLWEGEDNNKFRNHPQGRWSKLAYNILHHPAFYISDLVISVLLMMLAILERPSVIKLDNYHSLVIVHSVLEIVLLLLLAVDVVLRLIWFGPYNFIKHVRTVMVTVVLIVMFGEALAVLIRSHNHFRITRALRPLFFIDTFLMGGVRRVLRQVFYSLKPIIDVLLLIIFTVTFFALIAYYIFSADSKEYFGTFATSYVSLFILFTTSNDPDIFMELYSKQPAAPLFFVIYIGLTVYFIVNLLLAVVYSEFSTIEKKKFKKLFLHKREALHHAYSVLACVNGITFSDFLLLMQVYKPRMPEWQVMCVFKAMHRNPNAQHQDIVQEEFYNFYELKDLKWTKTSLQGDTLLWYEKQLPTKYQLPFWYINKLVTWRWLNPIVFVIMLAYNIFLIAYTLSVPATDVNHDALDIMPVVVASFVINVFFFLEILLRMIGVGPVCYFSTFWRILDFLIVLASLLCAGVEIDPRYRFLLVARPIVLIRILRLKRRYRNIFNMLATIWHRLLSIGLLLVVTYYFFAIIGMEMFGPNAVFKGCCNSSWYGVGRYYSGPQQVERETQEEVNGTLTTVVDTVLEGTTNVYYLTGFGNIFRSYVTLFILMVVNNWYIIMEGITAEFKYKWLSRLFFMAFYIVTLVVLQVVISFIVEAFVLRINDWERKYYCPIHQKVHHCLSVEDQLTRKEKEVVFVDADIQKIKYEVTYHTIAPRGRPDRLSFNGLIKRFRRIDLDSLKHYTRFIGRRKRNKEDIHLLLYKNDLEPWIKEQEQELREHALSHKRHEKNPWWRKCAGRLADFIVYVLE